MPRRQKGRSAFPDRYLNSDIVRSLLFFAFMIFWPDAVWAESTSMDSLSLGTVVCNIRENISPFVPLFNAIAYTIGAVLVFKSILLFKKHSENPNDPQIAKGIAHFLGGGALAGLPAAAGAIQQTLHMTSSTGSVTGCTPGALPTSGEAVPLDEMMRNFVGNIKDPMIVTLSVLCFIMGVFLIVKGLLKGAKTGVDQRATPHSIIVNLLIGGVFTTIGVMLVSMTNTLFGENSNNSFDQIINWTNITGGQVDTTRADDTVKSVLQFIQIVGAIAFIRGWLIVKNAIDGTGQATVPQGLTHIIGGTMAFNIGVMLRIFDLTFGTQLIN